MIIFYRSCRNSGSNRNINLCLVLPLCHSLFLFFFIQIIGIPTDIPFDHTIAFESQNFETVWSRKSRSWLTIIRVPWYALKISSRTSSVSISRSLVGSSRIRKDFGSAKTFANNNLFSAPDKVETMWRATDGSNGNPSNIRIHGGFTMTEI